MTEWDSEIEEFLPVVTEDNLQVLKLAGESGDHSPTPPPIDSKVKNGKRIASSMIKLTTFFYLNCKSVNYFRSK